MGNKKTKPDEVPVQVITRNENEIVMGEDDKHLYFGISLVANIPQVFP
jgi:hypothetical protein